MPRERQVGGLSDELDPYVDRAERTRFDGMGDLLRSQHPAPPPGLFERVAAGTDGEAPPNLWTQVTVALVVGFLLLAVCLLGASGSGPLGG